MKYQDRERSIYDFISLPQKSDCLHYEIIYQMLVELNKNTYGLSKTRLIQNLGLKINHIQLFNNVLLAKQLVEEYKPDINKKLGHVREGMNLYTVTSKGLRYMVLFKEIMETLN